jgi:hypothetical protein
MLLDDYKPKGTPDSRALCEEIAKRSDGVCILGFSRGKDSVCAWIWLRQFFHTIIPYHGCSCPNLTFVDESLDYYEHIFGTKIERFIDGEISRALGRQWYQPIEREDQIEALDRWLYTNNDIVDYLRIKHSQPQAYGAFALSLHDNMFRKMIIKRGSKHGEPAYAGAIRSKVRTFYPCFDWTTDQIISTIEDCGIALPDDYLISNRTIAGIPHNRNLDRFIKLYPDDFEKMQNLFPLIKAQWARNEFRKMKCQDPSKYYPNGIITVDKVIAALPQEMQPKPDKKSSRKRTQTKPKSTKSTKSTKSEKNK